MDTKDFDELAGRIEGVARAVLILAQMMERETCMDGPTLSRQWRDTIGQQPGEGSLDTARKTLHQMAQDLDDARSHYQELVAAARRADPSLMQHALQSAQPRSKMDDVRNPSQSAHRQV